MERLLIATLILCASLLRAAEADAVISWSSLDRGAMPVPIGNITNGADGYIGYFSWEGTTNRFSIAERDSTLEFPCSITRGGSPVTGGGTNMLVADSWAGGTNGSGRLRWYWDSTFGATVSNFAMCGFIKWSITNSGSADYLDFWAAGYLDNGGVINGYLNNTSLRIQAHALIHDASQPRQNPIYINREHWLYCVYTLLKREGWMRLRMYDANNSYLYLGETFSAIETNSTDRLWRGSIPTGYLASNPGTVSYGPMAYFYNPTDETIAALVPQPDVIASYRKTDWTLDGVPADTLTAVQALRTTNVNVQAYGAVGDGVANDFLAFKAAIDDLDGPTNVLYIPAGRYLITNRIYEPTFSEKTIRGDGTNSVVIFTNCEGFNLGNNDSITVYSLLAADAARGATNITLTNAAGFSVGAIMVVDQVDDPSFVSGMGRGCTWCDVSGDRIFHQRVMITAVDEDTDIVTFWPPLMWSFQTNLLAMAREKTPVSKWVGVESLKLIQRHDWSGYDLLTLNNHFQGWVHDVEFEDMDGIGLYQYDSLQCEVKRCLFRGIQLATNSDHAYGAEFLRCSHILVEDCAFDKCGAAMQFVASGGCVSGYNWFTNSYAYDQPTWITGSANPGHGGHAYLCLIEGNVGNAWRADNYFGSVSHHTVLRNAYDGWEQGRTNFAKTIDLMAWSLSNNIVGNVLGSGRSWTRYTNEVATSYGYDADMIYRVGYTNMGNYTTGGWDTRVWPSTLVHGNYDYFTNAVRWDASISTHTIPDSLYLLSRPTWFSNATWPPIESTTPSEAMIPAQYRYLGIDYSGAGTNGDPVMVKRSVKRFNAHILRVK